MWDNCWHKCKLITMIIPIIYFRYRHDMISVWYYPKQTVFHLVLLTVNSYTAQGNQSWHGSGSNNKQQWNIWVDLCPTPYTLIVLLSGRPVWPGPKGPLGQSELLRLFTGRIWTIDQLTCNLASQTLRQIDQMCLPLNALLERKQIL